MSRSNPLERAFRILDIMACADREMSLIEIVNAGGFPQSTTFRLTSNLVESGMLAFDKNRRVYSLGSRARRLAFFLRGHCEIRDLVLPVLETLSGFAGETTFFVRRGEDGLRMLRYVVPEIGARAFIHPGFDFPRHATAAGKVIHAFSDVESPTDGNRLRRYQDATVVDPDQLENLYQVIRQEGYAVNDSELDKGVYSIAAPVLVRSEVVGAIGIVGPRERMLENGNVTLAEVTAQLIEQTRTLSGTLSTANRASSPAAGCFDGQGTAGLDCPSSDI
jgi:DNA-binding IclR family transcriptional regulator